MERGQYPGFWQNKADRLPGSLPADPGQVRKTNDWNTMMLRRSAPPAASPFHVAREGADDAALAAVLVAALERDVFGLAEPARRRITVRAAWLVSVDREGGAAALE